MGGVTVVVLNKVYIMCGVESSCKLQSIHIHKKVDVGVIGAVLLLIINCFSSDYFANCLCNKDGEKNV